MKKVKSRFRKTDESGKKSILKFRDYEDEAYGEDPSKKRRKDVGKRLHRQKTAKDDFVTFDKD